MCEFLCFEHKLLDYVLICLCSSLKVDTSKDDFKEILLEKLERIDPNYCVHPETTVKLYCEYIRNIYTSPYDHQEEEFQENLDYYLSKGYDFDKAYNWAERDVERMQQRRVEDSYY